MKYFFYKALTCIRCKQPYAVFGKKHKCGVK